MTNYTKAAILVMVLTAGLWACVIWQRDDLAALIGLALLPSLAALEHEEKRAKRK